MALKSVMVGFLRAHLASPPSEVCLYGHLREIYIPKFGASDGSAQVTAGRDYGERSRREVTVGIMKTLWHTSLFLAVCILIGCGGGTSTKNSDPGPDSTPTPPVSAAKYGQWSTLSYTMPINPIHAALLRTGKILVVSGSGNDPKNPPPSTTIPFTKQPYGTRTAGRLRLSQ